MARKAEVHLFGKVAGFPGNANLRIGLFFCHSGEWRSQGNSLVSVISQRDTTFIEK